MHSKQTAPERDKSPEASVSGAKNTRHESRSASWLGWLHRTMGDCDWLRLFTVRDAVVADSVASGTTAPDPQALLHAVQSVLQAGHPTVVPASATCCGLLLIPLEHTSVRAGRVLVVANDGLETQRQQSIVQLARWSAAWLDTPADTGSDHQAASSTSPTFDEKTLSHMLVRACAEHESQSAVSITLVNGIARLCGCERVSLARKQGKRFRLLAISGQSRIDDRRDIVKTIFAAMHETLEHKRVRYPNSQASAAVPAHATLAAHPHPHPVLSFVLGDDDMVVLLERGREDTFLAAQADAIVSMLEPAGALLDCVARARAGLLQRGVQSFRQFVRTSVKPTAWTRGRICSMVALAFVIMLAIVPVPHGVSARAVIEAADRQVLVAAANGFIASAHARAGERVTSGDLLATLDISELTLAHEKWLTESSKNAQEYARALAMHDRVELSRLRAEADAIKAEIALLEQQIERSEIRAPFSGIVLKGDLTQSLGAPVDAGQVLFELGSAEQYRLILEVKERDVGYIAQDQVAALRMSALPSESWTANLESVLPVALGEKGRSVFRVPATIGGDATRLRPGMEGVARVHAGERPALWVYTHKLLGKLQYITWKLGWM